MKKFFLIVIFFVLSPLCLAQNYDAIYDAVAAPDFTLLKNIDPYQEADYYNYAWAPYPLFRTCSTLFFKNNVIEPGYYLLAARTVNGRDYVFFKENGIVKHIIPTYKTEAVPEYFYKNTMPQPLKTKWGKIRESTQKKFFKAFKGSKKEAPPQAFIQSNNLDNDYSEIVLFYGEKKYSMLFRLKRY